MKTPGRLRWYERLIVADYYLAALLLLAAAVIKLWTRPPVSDLLQALFELDIISFDILLAIDRWQAFIELALAVTALSGWQARIMAWLMACLYLLFTAAIAVASQGYLLLPIDCGCFGTGRATTPALFLILRNVFIALPLPFFRARLAHYTVYGRHKDQDAWDNG